MIYLTPYMMLLMRGKPLRGQVGGGCYLLGPRNWDFFGPCEMTSSRWASAIWGSQKSSFWGSGVRKGKTYVTSAVGLIATFTRPHSHPVKCHRDCQTNTAHRRKKSRQTRSSLFKSSVTLTRSIRQPPSRVIESHETVLINPPPILGLPRKQHMICVYNVCNRTKLTS